MKLTTSHRVSTKNMSCTYTTQVQYVRPKSIDNHAPARREVLIEEDYNCLQSEHVWEAAHFYFIMSLN